VGVAGNDRGNAPIITDRPFMEAFVHFVAEAGIRGGAGRVFYPTPLQIRPDMVDKELAHGGYGTTAHGVGLVAVDHEDDIVQEDGLVDLHPRKQSLVDVLVIFPIEVMIPPDLQVAGLCRIGVLEFSQKFIDRRVGDVDLVEVVVLPKLLGIAQLNIRETVFKVIFQGAAIDKGVLRKVVGTGAVPPVHVGHDDQFHAGGHCDMLDPFKFGKIAHKFVSPLGFAFGLH